jgi:site-specific DNA-methyltransferase (adenine-specific)
MLEINKIHQGDCLELMKNLPNNYAQLTITSPPYNVGGNNMNYRAKHKYDGNKEHDDNKSDYFKWLSERFSEMLRCSKYVFLNIQMLAKNKKDVLRLIAANQEYLKDIIIWGKKNPPPAMEQGVMNSGFEFILIFSKERPDKRKFYDCDFRGTVGNIIMTAVNRNEFASIHKAVFPLEIPEYIIKNFSKKGQIILDPFMGVGTTAAACKKLNRSYIGFEVSAEYCQVAEKRLRETEVPLDVFDKKEVAIPPIDKSVGILANDLYE